MGRSYTICCDELRQSLDDGDLRLTDKGILLGTNAIWYCPFCGEDVCWRTDK